MKANKKANFLELLSRSVLALFMMQALISTTLHASTECAMRFQRFVRHLDSLEDYLKGRWPDEAEAIIDRILEKDGRYPTFQIQGLARLYLRAESEPYQKVRDQFKTLEDAIGQADAATEYYEFARSIDAPLKAQEILRKKLKAARKLLKGEIEKWKEIRKSDSSHRLQRHHDRLQSAPQPSAADDRRQTIELFVAQIRKLEPLDYDMGSLQKGLHEMRRQVRWVPILLQALNGLVVLEDGEAGLPKIIVDEYGHLLGEDIAQSRFSHLPENPDIPKPIRLHRLLYLALSQTVNELGEIKTFGENVDALEEALMESDPEKYENHEDAFVMVETLLARKKLTYYDWRHQAERIQLRLLRTGLLKVIRKELENSL